jgi:hypothetical protein
MKILKIYADLMGTPNSLMVNDSMYHPTGLPYPIASLCDESRAEVEAYLAEHPEALVDEPVPPPPTKEQIAAQEEQSLMVYLASTDWYAIRYAETGKAIPEAILQERQSARDGISTLRKGA